MHILPTFLKNKIYLTKTVLNKDLGTLGAVSSENYIGFYIKFIKVTFHTPLKI